MKDEIEVNIFEPILFLLVNILADAFWGCLLIFILEIGFFPDFIMTAGVENNNLAFLLIYSPYVVTVIGRLFVLPITCQWIENKQDFQLSKRFITFLKSSYKVQLITLFLVLFLSPPWYPLNFYELRQCFIYKSTIGLFGSYIVLFVYWWIEGKIKKLVKHKKQEC